MGNVINAGDLRKGLKLEIDGEPYLIVDFEFTKPGKGQALYKCRLKNLITGVQFDRTYRSGDRFIEADTEEKEAEYLYKEGNKYYFMITSTYEQVEMTKEQLGDATNYLVENTKVNMLFFKEKPIAIVLPNFVNLRVIKAGPGVKGDTASSATKPVVLETGYEVQVPLFVEEGDVLKIDTRTGLYVERV